MATKPKPVPRKRTVANKASSTLSASEALKAAEAAVGSSPESPPAARVKAAKVPTRAKPAPAAKADPVVIAAATTALDAAPEPAGASVAVEPAPSDPIAIADEAPVELKEIKSLSPQAGPVEPALLPATEGTKMMNDVIETGKKFAQDTKAKFDSVYTDLNEKAKVGVEKSTKAIEEISDIAKGNVEALVESGKIAAKGIESLGQEAVDYSRKNFEKATASIKSFSTVKTPTEFFQLQSQLFSASFDELTKEAAKSSEALIKLAGDVAQPLTARVTVVTDKVKSFAA